MTSEESKYWEDFIENAKKMYSEGLDKIKTLVLYRKDNLDAEIAAHLCGIYSNDTTGSMHITSIPIFFPLSCEFFYYFPRLENVKLLGTSVPIDLIFNSYFKGKNFQFRLDIYLNTMFAINKLRSLIKENNIQSIPESSVPSTIPHSMFGEGKIRNGLNLTYPYNDNPFEKNLNFTYSPTLSLASMVWSHLCGIRECTPKFILAINEYLLYTNPSNYVMLADPNHKSSLYHDGEHLCEVYKNKHKSSRFYLTSNLVSGGDVVYANVVNSGVGILAERFSNRAYINRVLSFSLNFMGVEWIAQNTSVNLFNTWDKKSNILTFVYIPKNKMYKVTLIGDNVKKLASKNGIMAEGNPNHAHYFCTSLAFLENM